MPNYGSIVSLMTKVAPLIQGALGSKKKKGAKGATQVETTKSGKKSSSAGTPLTDKYNKKG